VGWKVVRLEALKTAGLAISNLEQIYFMGAARDVRGETRLAIDNQGAPAIELPVQGEPTFASIAGEAAFLTLDQAGRLFLPLGQGEQAVVVQSKRMFRSALGFAAVALELPGLGAPASEASVELRYPPEWIPFYEELSPESRLGLLDGRDLTLLAILAVLTERLLALLQIRLRRRIPLAGALVLAAAFASPIYRVVFLVAALCYLAVAAALLARRFSGARLAGALAALAALAFFGTLLGSMLVEGILPTAAHYEARRLAEEPAYAASAPMADNVLRKSKGLEEMKDATSGVAGAAAPPAAYQGLPARIELPRGARQTVFHRQLLATDEPRRVFVLLASSRLVALLTWVTALLALGLVMRSRRELAQGARDLITRLRAPLPKEQT
jgi:hypothetical protein